MFEAAEYIGIIAFAVSGFFVAVRSRLDFLGVLVSMFLTALGGGIIRDVIVGRIPYAFSDNIPAIVILCVMMLLFLLRFHTRASIENRLFFILSDSIGLISFSIAGALIAIESALNLTGTLVLAFITAVGGGITRDVIINEVPFVFKTGFYGTVSLLAGFCVYLFEKADILNFYSITGILVMGVLLRIIAYYRKWSIPLV